MRFLMKISTGLFKVSLRSLKESVSFILCKFSCCLDLVKQENVFFISATNSGKILPAVMFPEIVDELIKLGL